MVKKKTRISSRREEDPMAGTTNLVDAMLVISVGFLIFIVLSWNMQSIIFDEDMTPEEKQEIIKTVKEVSEINQGEEVDNNIDTSQNSGEGYTELGKVYKDPKTGKLILIE
jgi:hypothetical protein